MNIKTFGALAAVALLAACGDTKPATMTDTNGAGAAAPAAKSITPGSKEDFAANVVDRVFFGFDKSNLSDDSKAVLDSQAAWLSKYSSVAVQIAGNCDERGTEEYNIALGNRRAHAAMDYLTAKGVAKARITTVSNGKDKPTALGSNEDAWKQNRNAITSIQ